MLIFCCDFVRIKNRKRENSKENIGCNYMIWHEPYIKEREEEKSQLFHCFCWNLVWVTIGCDVNICYKRA